MIRVIRWSTAGIQGEVQIAGLLRSTRTLDVTKVDEIG